MAAGGNPARLELANGPFEARHRALMGAPIDLGDLSPAVIPGHLLPAVRATWQERVQSEFRSVQIMTRFLTEVTGAGDPLDVYSAALELVQDEVRHAALCMAVCRCLDVPALLPKPVALPDPPAFLQAPLPERALGTAITMLVINETISTALITDLLDRCDYPPIRRVLQATVQDETVHGAFGWDYARASLARFEEASHPEWRRLTALALEPHFTFAAQALSSTRAESHTLDAFPEPHLARLGLLSAQRQALVFRRVFARVLAPRLRVLELLA